MLKVGRKRKRKERQKNKKHTNLIARIRARVSRPAVSFACLKLYHAAKKTKYKIRSISEYYVTNNHGIHRLKKKHFSNRSNANKGKTSDVNRANIFCRKKIKAEESDPLKQLFFNGRLS